MSQLLRITHSSALIIQGYLHDVRETFFPVFILSDLLFFDCEIQT